MKTYVKYLMVLAMLCGSMVVFAQEEVPEPGKAQTPGPPPPGLVVPIDSGIVILIISGFLLGGFTLIKSPRTVH